MPDDAREPARSRPLLRPYDADDLVLSRTIGKGVRRDGGLAIEPPILSHPAGRSRIESRIAGSPLWIEADRPLVPAIESALSAFACHAFALGRPLLARGPVEARFAVHLDGIAAILAQWQSWPQPAPALEAPELTEAPAPAPGRALFFTGGVDSFFSLWRLRGQVDALLHAQGLDFALDDDEGIAAMRRSIDAVAASLDLQVVRLTTNLRSHPLFSASPWDLTHVSALAALAHPLRGSFGRVTCAGADAAIGHGSHPALDRLYGGGALVFETDGYPDRRPDKVAAIAGWDLVQKHLQICWQARPGRGNCGVCEKCVRTTTMFALAGSLPRMETLPQGPLEPRIRALPPVSRSTAQRWVTLARATSDQGLRASIEDLVARSEAARGWRGRVAPLAPLPLQRWIRTRRLQRGIERHWPS